MAIPMLQSIPARFAMPCEFCKQLLDVRDHGVYRHTSGWVMQRPGGGGHGVSLAKREPRWAHQLCIERQASGTDGQSRLFE